MRILFALILLAAGIAILGHFRIPALLDRMGVTLDSRRFVFIDGGAHKGETVQHFMKTVACSMRNWTVISFEPNPHLLPALKKLEGVEVRTEAISDSDGVGSFYFSKDEDQIGGSLNKSKFDVVSTPLDVATIDLSRWIRETFSKEDVIWLKLDIEGGEYPVLDKILRDNTTEYVDRLFIEFHSDMVGLPTSRDDELIKELRKRGVVLTFGDIWSDPGDWFPRSCLAYALCGLWFCGDPAGWYAD